MLLYALASAQTDAARLAEQGIRHLEANHFDAAKTAFEKSLKLDPSQYEALSGLGFVHFSSGDFAEARKHLEKAVALQPKSFQSRFLLGAALVQLRDKGAIASLRAAHALNPKHADVRKLLAAQYVESRRYGEAIALLQPAVKDASSDEEIHLLLIEARLSSGDSAGAYELAQRAWARFPKSAQVAAWLGFQLQFAGRYDEAIDLLRKAIDLDASFPVSVQLLGETYLKKENYTEAVVWLRRASDKMPLDADTLLSLSRALSETGETTAAMEVLQQAARAAPRDSRVHLQLSRLYFRMGDESRAREAAGLSIKLREGNAPTTQPPASLRTGR